MPSILELKAYVLVNVDLGQEKHVTEILKKVEGVSHVYVVYGVYDIIVEVEAGSKEAIKETIFNKIRVLEKIRKTNTLLVVGDTVIDK